MLYWIDLFGTLAFAVSGASLGARRGVDLLGMVVLAVSTGVGGGIIRDAVLGNHPPGVFRDETYLLVCIGGAAAVILFPKVVARSQDLVMRADALGLAVFAALGAAQGEQSGLGPIGIMMMAAMTATGGGVVRDVLVARVPVIIRKDFYATAAMIGGGLWWLLGLTTLGQGGRMAIVIGVTLTLRLWAMAYNVKLPIYRSAEPGPPED